MLVLLAYRGDPHIKAECVRRVRMQRATHERSTADRAIHGDELPLSDAELGIPAWLALLKNATCQNLPDDRAMDFAERFLTAIAPGADLEAIRLDVMRWILADPRHGARRYESAAARRAISMILLLIRCAQLFGRRMVRRWSQASAPEWAVEWADTAASLAAKAAATSPDAAREAWWVAFSQELPRLLRNAPVPARVGARAHSRPAAPIR